MTPVGNEEETAVYVYAVTREVPEAEAAVAALPGVLGTPVRTVSEGGLTALAGRVPAHLFGEEALKRQLEDLEQLESMARAHNAVVEAVTARTLALPLRLATVYLDEERVREMLRERAEEFRELLGRLEGHLELGVKVYADPQHRPAASEQSGAGERAPAARAAVSPGRAYLQQRRMQRRSREDAYRSAEQAAAAVAAEAELIAVDRVRHRLQQGELAAGPGQNIANDAYLVPVAQAEEFRRRVLAAGEAPGVRVEVTGPWAPYSFATPPPDAAPAPAGEGPAGGAVAGAPGSGER
ncbi:MULTISPECIES: GvpL/GvpF family gas vesicle protein [Streptomyces]|uniref:GvpL/GvpF family gas vesicle protein n=1 Tax=Streptomyces TaxID=1883 RepID=UPI0021751071|nr:MULTISPECIES: GvpL/GvpF family gas vesicle protein [unclassified Streptomyces]MCZ2527444.1 GvpL/GvpF family gas vesicle protein [Streptomyces sp. HB2AG]